MKSENPDPQLSDIQLDELLRDVVVPDDLKSNLREIAQAETEIDAVTTPPKTDKFNFPFLRMALAASLLFVLFFVSQQWNRNNRPDSGMVANKKTTPNNAEALNAGRATSTGPVEVLVSTEASTDFLESQIAEMEVVRLRAQLNELEFQHVPALDQLEIESLIAALAGEIVLPLGGSEASTRDEMANVITKYPGSRGAEMAKQFLDRLETN